MGNGHLRAVHPRPVATAEVAQVEVTAVSRDLRMQERHACVGEVHLYVRVASDADDRRAEGKTAPAPFEVSELRRRRGPVGPRGVRGRGGRAEGGELDRLADVRG